MSAGGTGNATSGETTGDGLERLPPKAPYAHDAILRIQRLDAKLGGLGLLEVAKGLLPTEVFEMWLQAFLGSASQRVDEPKHYRTSADQGSRRTSWVDRAHAGARGARALGGLLLHQGGGSGLSAITTK